MLNSGDLLIFFGRDLLSRVIEFATGGFRGRGPSHVGIVARRYGREFVFESTTLCDLPCALTGHKKSGVQAHLAADRVASYPGRVLRVPLRGFWRLDRHEENQLWEWAVEHFLADSYDLRDALISGTRLLKWSALLPYPDLGSVFCSELCAALLMRLHRMRLDDPARFNPASLIAELRRCGVYGAPEDFVATSPDRGDWPRCGVDVLPFLRRESRD